MTTTTGTSSAVNALTRWLGLYSACLMAFGVAVWVLAGLNNAVWHYVSYIDTYRSMGGTALGAGLGGLVLAALLRRRLPRTRPRMRWWSWLLLGLGTLVLGYAALMVVSSLLYDFTFERRGALGASLATLGV